MEALKVDGVSRLYGGIHALDGVSFGVTAGERLGIIGPNGAGKTTLFNVLTGAPPPTAGSVYLHGQDITHLPVHLRTHLGLARSFQIVTLFPRLTVLQHMQLAVHGTRPSRYHLISPVGSYPDVLEHAAIALSRAGLWDKRSEKVASLAYGEQRKLEFVMSLASQPKVLLLDEPGAGLTAAERKEMADLIRGLSQVTVLIVDHDMDLVFGVADRIVVLHYGQIIAEGTPELIRLDPRVREIYLGAWGERRARAH